MRAFKISLLIIIGTVCITYAQPVQPSASQIKMKLDKLKFLGSVLYVAAHPDDENTRIITYLANGRLAATAYLSMTRGDGGQNLIGPEIRDLLGLIRTQELLAARRIDGGAQYFTRANDFGFSKSADETFSIWGRENILGDVVKVYREFQPDVIITRFPPDERAGHGHHTASAILAQEAFDAAIDPKRFATTATQFGVWQPKGVYTNTGRWWNTTINENTPGIVTIDVGAYSYLLGESYTEIAARSRSQHKSQGFGSSGTRGYQPEFLEFVKGEKVSKDIFENINTTWTRVKNGDKVLPLVEKAIQQFNPEDPSACVPQLFAVRNAIAALDASVWKTRKLAEVEQVIKDCLGLYVKVKSDHYWVSPGQKVVFTAEVVNRSSAGVTLDQMVSSQAVIDTTLNSQLTPNVGYGYTFKRNIPSNFTYTDPYWLHEDHAPGYFKVNDASLIGKPERTPPLWITFYFRVGNDKLIYDCPVIFQENDPVKGEVTRPVEVVPAVVVNLDADVMIFNDASPRQVNLVIKSTVDNPVSGTVMLDLPKGWQCQPATVAFGINKKGDEQLKSFSIQPPDGETNGYVYADAIVGIDTLGRSLRTIAYDHIPTQTIQPRAKVKVIRLNLKKQGLVVGYIKGAGDDVPKALRNMGYQVWEMKDEEITAENLKTVDAVVVGIRAVNTNERLPFVLKDLYAYANNGGTVVMQYNTAQGLETNEFTPFALKLSRDRVTEEDAEVRILKAGHEALSKPNVISSKDFDGWVQERGLYFPETWDSHFEPLISMNDRGETAKDGSLLVAAVGKGHFVYTSLSFFRELPEGVPGAYRLFANLVSLGKNDSALTAKVKKKKK